MMTKTFDAVTMTRNLRDQLAAQLENRSPGERVEYLRSLAEVSSLRKKLLPAVTVGAEAAESTGASGDSLPS